MTPEVLSLLEDAQLDAEMAAEWLRRARREDSHASIRAAIYHATDAEAAAKEALRVAGLPEPVAP